MHTKTIHLGGYGAVTIYSFDGRTWSTRREDLTRYTDRYDRERRELQRQFARIDTAEQFQIEY